MSQPPMMSRISPLPRPIEKPRRSNARVHSPNFYQSLKSRWKSDSPNPSAIIFQLPPPTSDQHPTVDSNLHQKHSQMLKPMTDPIHGSTETSQPALLPSPTLGLVQDIAGEILETEAGIHQISPMIALSPSPPANPTPFGPTDVADHQLPVPIERCRSAPPTSVERNLPVVQSTSKVQVPLSPPTTVQKTTSVSSPNEPQTEASEITQATEVRVSKTAFQHSTTEIQKSHEKLRTSTLPPHTSSDCCNDDLGSHVKPPPKQTSSPPENQPNQPRDWTCSEKLVRSVSNKSSVTHNKPSGGPKSKATSVGCPERGPGNPSYVDVPSQIDQPIRDIRKLDKLDIVEGLLHKNHISFATRRYSISQVLKSPDSIDASTPLLFQGIWEKELEENERKWKRLARVSGSQPSSVCTFHSDEKDEMVKGHDTDATTMVARNRTVRPPSTRGSSHSKKPSRKFSQASAILTSEIQAQNDMLEKVWDSFKTEAEISLSDINCDGTLVGHFASSFDPLGWSPEADPLPLAPAEPRSNCLDGVETPQVSTATKTEKPIGLGLFHQCQPPAESDFSASNEFSPITSPKLKKLSLLSNSPICSSVIANSRGKRRPTHSKPSYKATPTNDSNSSSDSLDVSLLNAFPAPPCKDQLNRSSPTPFSLKILQLPDSPRKIQAISANASVNQLPGSIGEPSLKNPASVNQTCSISTSKPATSRLITFHPTSFSNRPRAQTSGRSPIPPPLKLRTNSPQPNPEHRRRTLTVNCNHEGNSGSEAVPPVPVLRAPNTAPLQSISTFESYHRERDAEPVPSSDLVRPNLSSAAMNSKLLSSGFTPKRPSLLIRPNLRSPRVVGGARVKETNLNPHSPYAPMVTSPEVFSPFRTAPPMGQSISTLLAHSPTEQAACFSSPHASVDSSTGTASSGSTVPSPATPTSLRMTYNNRLPPVPMYPPPLYSPSAHSPIQSIHPDNPRYVIINQTPKYSSNNERVAPNTIKASRTYRGEFLKPKAASPEPLEKVSYGMAL